MPDLIDAPKDAPKPSFQQIMAASRPSNEQERKAMEAGVADTNPPPPPKPDAAPPKPPEVKAAVAPDPDEEILSGRRNPKSEDYKRVKTAATEANKRAEELKAKFEAATKEAETLRKSRGDTDKLAVVEKERDELKSKWQSVAAQFDSGFQAKYDTMVSEAIDKIKGAVPAEKFSAVAYIVKMEEGEQKRKLLAEATEDLDAPTVTEIMLANREVRDIFSARKKELNDSGEVLKTSAEQRRKEQEERKTAYAKSFDATLARKSTGDDALPVLKTREGDSADVKAWNEGVAERAAVARAYFMDEYDTPEQKADASILAASAPGFLSELKSARTRIAELEQTLAGMQSSSPGIGAGGKGADGGTKMTFQERMAKAAL